MQPEVEDGVCGVGDDMMLLTRFYNGNFAHFKRMWLSVDKKGGLTLEIDKYLLIFVGMGLASVAFLIWFKKVEPAATEALPLKYKAAQKMLLAGLQFKKAVFFHSLLLS